MARSYGRRKATRNGGTLVRENPIQRAVSVNSLYPIPVRIKVSTSSPLAVCSTDAVLGPKSLDFKTEGGIDKSLANVVRISSIDMSSKSPFSVTVNNSLGKLTTYKCVGQKINKIIPSRETSICGNPALLAAASTNINLIGITDAEDQVDIVFHCVVDGDLD